MEKVTSKKQFEDLVTNLRNSIESAVKNGKITERVAHSFMQDTHSLDALFSDFLYAQGWGHPKTNKEKQDELMAVAAWGGTLVTPLKNRLVEINRDLRGGARPGAGRKPVGDYPKKKISASVSREASEALKNLEVVLDAKNRSQVVDYLLTAAWEKYEQMPADQRPNLTIYFQGR